jgi:hypothetical protein
MACDLDPSIRSAAGTNEGQIARAKATQKLDVVTNIPVGGEAGETMSVEELIDSTYDRLNRRTG